MDSAKKSINSALDDYARAMCEISQDETEKAGAKYLEAKRRQISDQICNAIAIPANTSKSSAELECSRKGENNKSDDLNLTFGVFWGSFTRNDPTTFTSLLEGQSTAKSNSISPNKQTDPDASKKSSNPSDEINEENLESHLSISELIPESGFPRLELTSQVPSPILPNFILDETESEDEIESFSLPALIYKDIDDDNESEFGGEIENGISISSLLRSFNILMYIRWSLTGGEPFLNLKVSIESVTEPITKC
ncbi:hypothetical protein TWF694_005106 [Orbilia ellipsospora]|uniref:Uncharacterized protein n=1 Tax=Orbilia ellipsospora TaxID=2528407 RepID=A0AAV9WVL9_9PEZI